MAWRYVATVSRLDRNRQVVARSFRCASRSFFATSGRVFPKVTLERRRRLPFTDGSVSVASHRPSARSRMLPSPLTLRVVIFVSSSGGSVCLCSSASAVSPSSLGMSSSSAACARSPCWCWNSSSLDRWCHQPRASCRSRSLKSARGSGALRGTALRTANHQVRRGNQVQHDGPKKYKRRRLRQRFFTASCRFR